MHFNSYCTTLGGWRTHRAICRELLQSCVNSTWLPEGSDKEISTEFWALGDSRARTERLIFWWQWLLQTARIQVAAERRGSVWDDRPCVFVISWEEAAREQSLGDGSWGRGILQRGWLEPACWTGRPTNPAPLQLVGGSGCLWLT